MRKMDEKLVNLLVDVDVIYFRLQTKTAPISKDIIIKYQNSIINQININEINISYPITCIKILNKGINIIIIITIINNNKK